MTGSVSRRGFLAGAGATGLLVAARGPAQAVTAVQRRSAPATVILNGRVYTGTAQAGHQEAVAISASGRILEVGSISEIRRRVARSTHVIDAKGGTIMSGIHDGHM